MRPIFSSSFWSWPSSKYLKQKGTGLFPKWICQTVWGDGLRAETEECEDGNTNDGNGWSSCYSGRFQESNGIIFMRIS